MVKKFYLAHRWDMTTVGQGVPGSNGNEGVLYIPQNSRAGASRSDILMSGPGHFLLP